MWPPENPRLYEKLHGKSSFCHTDLALKILRSTFSDRAKNGHVSFTSESSQQRQTPASEEE